jgi:HSP20 family molecular chaperone IbpA
MLAPRRNVFRSGRPSTFSNLIDEFLMPNLRTPQYPHNTPSVFDVVQKVDEENDTAVTHMFLPGITSEQVDVSVNMSASVINVVVNIEETGSNEFMNQIYSERIQRSFRMTSDYDVEQTKVDLTNGILTLTTPRIEKSPQSIKLSINTKQIETKKE